MRNDKLSQLFCGGINGKTPLDFTLLSFKNDEECQMQISDFVSVPQVATLGRCPFDQIWAEMEHSDPCSELMYVLQGSVEVKTRDYTIDGHDGDIIYTPAGMPHRDVFPADSIFEVYLLRFQWSGEKEMLQSFDPVSFINITHSAKKQIAAQYYELYQEFISDQPFSRDMVNIQLMQIILRLKREATMMSDNDIVNSHDAGSARRMQLMSQAKRVIEERFCSTITLEDIASKLNISPYYLSHIFSNESGFSLSHYLRDVRMSKAAGLLEDHRLNINEIALSVGFSDPIYFRRVFKAYFGMSPKAYRTKMIINH